MKRLQLTNKISSDSNRSNTDLKPSPLFCWGLFMLVISDHLFRYQSEHWTLNSLPLIFVISATSEYIYMSYAQKVQLGPGTQEQLLLYKIIKICLMRGTFALERGENESRLWSIWGDGAWRQIRIKLFTLHSLLNRHRCQRDRKFSKGHSSDTLELQQ